VVELGKVLGDNPDISVLIEGHTDDDRFSASGPIADNWDLSTKGYAIVAILVKIKASIKLNRCRKKRIFAISRNATAEGKAKTEELRLS
jgi:chemotaxis protein MotB